MWAYIVRRTLLTIPTVLGILILTFSMFSLVAKDPARAYAGKQASAATLKAIRHKMGIDKPLFFNPSAMHQKGSRGLFDSQFFDLLFFRFGNSMRYEESVWTLIATRGPISLAIQLPAFLIVMGLEMLLALYVARHRGEISDILTTAVSVMLMSVPPLALYIVLQWVFGARLRLFPVAGWASGYYAVQFAALPIIASVMTQFGGGARFYRTVVLDEINSEYVRTAQAKGVGPRDVMLTHVLRNVMIPVITNTVTALPFLVLGALILEELFQVPGIGGLLVQSIFNGDRSPVLAITYVTSIAYCVMLLISDILYTIVDPRVSFS